MGTTRTWTLPRSILLINPFFLSSQICLFYKKIFFCRRDQDQRKCFMCGDDNHSKFSCPKMMCLRCGLVKLLLIFHIILVKGSKLFFNFLKLFLMKIVSTYLQCDVKMYATRRNCLLKNIRSRCLKISKSRFPLNY